MIAEVELMKERFAKLLLGEDMSGGGKGVCAALAISNAITNLSGLYKLFVFFPSSCLVSLPAPVLLFVSSAEILIILYLLGTEKTIALSNPTNLVQ